MPYKYFTIRDHAHIRANWQTKTDEELAADLNRTPESITNFRRRFKLTDKHRIEQFENQ